MSTLADTTLADVPRVDVSAKRPRHVLAWVVVLGILALLAAAAIAIPLYNSIGAHAQSAKVMADTRALASAVSMYQAHMGTLPENLDDLRYVWTNVRGVAAGPFLIALPTQPIGNEPYRYERDANGEFRVASSDVRGVVVTAGPRGVTSATLAR